MFEVVEGESDFVADSLWSPRVAAEHLERELGAWRSWQQWLAHDRRKPNPMIPSEKFAGYSVLYRRGDIEKFARETREKIINEAR